MVAVTIVLAVGFAMFGRALSSSEDPADGGTATGSVRTVLVDLRDLDTASDAGLRYEFDLVGQRYRTLKHGAPFTIVTPDDTYSYVAPDERAKWGGRSWVRSPTGQAADGFRHLFDPATWEGGADAAQVGVQLMWGAPERPPDMVRRGQETIDGVPLTRYSTATPGETLDVWVDEEGRFSRARFSGKAGHLEARVVEYNTPVDIRLPNPADWADLK